MKNQRFQLGLVAEGNTALSTTLGLSRLVEELGPIKSVNISASRRLANTLGYGYPITDYAGFSSASAVIIRAPDAAIPRIVEEMCLSDLVLQDLPVVLCESWLGVAALEKLSSAGAQAATTVNLPVLEKDWFVVEGHLRPVRIIRKLIERSGGKCHEMDESGKNFLFAADLLISALAPPIYTTAQQCLRASGFAGNILASVLEQMLQRTTRDFLRGSGTKARWGGPLLDCTPETGREHLERVAKLDRRLAEFIDGELMLARTMHEMPK